MNKHLIILGIAVLLICVGLSGCTTRRTPISEGYVDINIEEVVITSELEIEEYFTNTTKIEISNTTSFVIISLSVENKDIKWLTVQTGIQSLTDNMGNKYNSMMFVEINNSSYTTEQLKNIDEEEALGWNRDVAPKSKQIKKAVFELPLDRIPEKIYISYGFKETELADVEKWYYTSFTTTEEEEIDIKLVPIEELNDYPYRYINQTVKIKGRWNYEADYFMDYVRDNTGLIYIDYSEGVDYTELFTGAKYTFTGVVKSYTTFYGDKVTIVIVSDYEPE